MADDDRSGQQDIVCALPQGGETMWTLPQAVSVAAGVGEGNTDLNAFDRALRDAGIADLNLIRVTSIFPLGARMVPMRPYPPGVLMPAVYAKIVGHIPGERIAAAVGVGIGEEGYGVIMEYSHTGTRDNAEEIVRRMVAESMAMRGLKTREIIVAASEHVVDRTGCVVAAVLFWPD